jgi:hypothetical protein
MAEHRRAAGGVQPDQELRLRGGDPEPVRWSVYKISCDVKEYTDGHDRRYARQLAGS